MAFDGELIFPLSRYPGFSSLMNSFRMLGLLNNKDHIELASWETLVSQASALTPLARKGETPLAAIISTQDAGSLRDALEWLGLVRSDMLQLNLGSRAMPPVPKGKHTPLDLFAYLLSQKLKYGPNERDMVVLSHEIISMQKVGDRWQPEVHTSTLISKGTREHNVGYQGERPASAMARTVGIPVAIAAMLVAEGKLLDFKGVVRPIHRDIYQPILEGLEEVGLKMVEKSSVGLEGKTTVELSLMRARRGDTASYREQEYQPPLRDLDLDSDHGWNEEQGVVVV